MAHPTETFCGCAQPLKRVLPGGNNNPDAIENFKSSSHCTSRWLVHSSVLRDMDGHQESQFEWLSAKVLSGSKVKEC